METKKPLFSKSDLVAIALPLIIQQVLAVTIGMVDTLMVSSAGEAAVSGVSLVNSLDTMLVIAFGALVSGGAVVVAQFLGQQNREGALSAAKQLTYATTAVALFISVAVIILEDFLMGLLFGDVEPDVMKAAKDYFAQQEVFMDLTKLLSQDQLTALEGRLVYQTLKDGTEVPTTIDLSGLPLDEGCTTGKGLYIGFPGNTGREDKLGALVEYLLVLEGK